MDNLDSINNSDDDEEEDIDSIKNEILNQLAKDYIKKENISKSNIEELAKNTENLKFITITKMLQYMVENSNVVRYVAHTLFVDEKNDVKYLNFIIYFDYVNKTYEIEPTIDTITDIKVLNLNKEINSIESNDNNKVNYDIINTKEYKEMIEKVHTYIPQSSVIGRLLNHQEKYTVVKSIQKGIMQHDLYSWQVEGIKPIVLNELTNGSEFVDKTIKQWLDNVEPEKREVVIDTIFDILNTTEVDSVVQIKENWIKNVGIMLKNYKNLDDESKKMITEIVKKLIVTAKNNFVEDMPVFGKKKSK